MVAEARRLPVSLPVHGVLVLAVLALATGASATQYEGSPCFHEDSQSRGVCKLLPYCSWAVKERRSDLYPQTCSYDGYMPVVCCPYTRTHDPPHLPLRPTRPILAGLGPDGVALVVPVMEAAPPLNIGGLLGPVPPSHPSHASSPDQPDRLQQEVGVLDRLLGIIELSDGSALFARRGRTRPTSTSTTTAPSP
ncbi:uncharacterized protein LOC117642594 [Thrips palmi]|uniref:Uncharacterized protein LOC117642594 n=1 Tax=Thrips palmi TaxID=161013 RepID=A0A6P8YJA1_THRPL|nr:uncharacterized protein LOC117642594 [Thrips palmi]